jgi:hypothetical protein
MYTDSEARSKLDPKSRKCNFIGYGIDEFGYRFGMRKIKKLS